jgi:DEAD/DEAH box helicase domain-containing protein
MGYVAFDLEIMDGVDGVTKTWDDARNGRCGVSVLCLYDSDLDQYLMFDNNNLTDGLQYLRHADLIVGFNSREFDVPCLEGAVGQSLGFVPHCDMLQEIWGVLGKRRKGFKLADICERTLGITKNTSGDHAPDLYAAGRFAELHTYCLRDVQLTARLFEYIVDNGHIIDPVGDKLEVNIGRSSEARVTGSDETE